MGTYYVIRQICLKPVHVTDDSIVGYFTVAVNVVDIDAALAFDAKDYC